MYADIQIHHSLIDGINQFAMENNVMASRVAGAPNTYRFEGDYEDLLNLLTAEFGMTAVEADLEIVDQ